MIHRYKNTYGDGTVEYIEIDIPDPDPDDEDATDEEIVEALEGIA